MCNNVSKYSKIKCIYLFCRFSNSVALMNVVPYSAFMVMDFGLTNDKKATGFYAGYIMSAFMLGRFLSSFYCGQLADKISRKFVMRYGLWSCVIFGICFGMAPTYNLALLARLLMGLFNGIAAAAKAILPELVPQDQQQKAMGLVSAMWNAGQVVGPALGGILAGGSTFPYLLPNLIASILGLIALLFVERYLPGKVNKGRQQHLKKSWSSLSRKEKGPIASSSANRTDTTYAPVGATDDYQDNDNTEIIKEKKPTVPLTAAGPIAIYSIFSLVSIAYDEMYPLFLLLPIHQGGCSMMARDIGIIMSATAIGNLVLQFTVFPFLATRIGSSTMFRISNSLSTGLVLLPPLLVAMTTNHNVNQASISTWIVLIGHNIIYRFATSAAYTALFCCINNSAPASLRGTVNGVSMTVASLFKAAGPTIGGATFAWSQRSRKAPFHSHFAFVLTAFSFFFCSVGALTLLGKQFDIAYREDTALDTHDDSSSNMKKENDDAYNDDFSLSDKIQEDKEKCPVVVIEMTPPRHVSNDENYLPFATVSLSSYSSDEQEPLRRLQDAVDEEVENNSNNSRS
uniref:Major facilitator superfamily (MFS) profile domain-containing protein n=1 Tax=Aureoumbra lagunensis TaxID=44058 RepID=A0A7S3NKF4_9STRA